MEIVIVVGFVIACAYALLQPEHIEWISGRRKR